MPAGTARIVCHRYGWAVPFLPINISTMYTHQARKAKLDLNFSSGQLLGCPDVAGFHLFVLGPHSVIVVVTPLVTYYDAVGPLIIITSETLIFVKEKAFPPPLRRNPKLGLSFWINFFSKYLFSASLLLATTDTGWSKIP
ncbi:hypothetical protein F4679DRAFT_335635 [Xylaria curta]|nr:hypothetical protein F4679DRAFT_335635 [Xylaria curta]